MTAWMFAKGGRSHHVTESPQMGNVGLQEYQVGGITDLSNSVYIIYIILYIIYNYIHNYIHIYKHTYIIYIQYSIVALNDAPTNMSRLHAAYLTCSPCFFHFGCVDTVPHAIHRSIMIFHSKQFWLVNIALNLPIFLSGPMKSPMVHG